MRHVRGLESLRLERAYLTVGVFDGVHLGHQAIVDALVAAARREGVPSVALTFFPHPTLVLRGHRPHYYLTSPEMRARLLDERGVDLVVTQPFDLPFSRLSAGAFLDLLQEHLGARGLWVGPDFAFGHQRQGNVAYLEAVKEARGFEVHVVPPVTVDGEAVSSTRIRQALAAGEVALAARLLGRLFAVEGRVVRGDGRGRELGVPTANLALWEEQALPAVGVYACLAEVDGETYAAATNVGLRPMFEEDRQEPLVEAHLLAYNGNLYDRSLRLAFLERLRAEVRFETVEELVAQMREDIARTEAIVERARERGHV